MDRTGQILGNYRLISLLGKGGFANVYLAEHLHLNTRAAIKILQVRLVGNSMEQFKNEARAIASLIHPHIIRVLDFGIEDDIPFLIMDYAANGTMRQRVPRTQRLPLPEVVTYVKQVAEALQYAHTNRLIHRDVKPENMLLSSQDTILLSDFGLVVTAPSTNTRTLKEMAGTIHYMAPEQIHGHPRATSDQYALGIVAYEWLSGDRPFHGTFTEIITQHIVTPPPPLLGKIEGVSPEVEQVLQAALAKDPLQRFASVTAFATALEQAAGMKKPAAPPPVPFNGFIPINQEFGQSTQSDLPTQFMNDRREMPTLSSASEEFQGSQAQFTRSQPSQSFRSANSSFAAEAAIATPQLTPELTPRLDTRAPTLEGGAETVPSDPNSTFMAPLTVEPPINRSIPPAQNMVAQMAVPQIDRPIPPVQNIAAQMAVPQIDRPARMTAIPGSGIKHRTRRIHWPIPLVAVLVVSIVLGSVAYFSPGALASLIKTFSPGSTTPIKAKGSVRPERGTTGIGPSTAATITLTTISKDLSNAFTVSAVTGTPDPTQSQVAANYLSSTKSQSDTATATGSGSTPTKFATGTITFDFPAPNPVDYPIGTTFTGTSGVQVATDEDANIPATPNFTLTVAAHAVKSGASGNIPAGDINQSAGGGSLGGDTITNGAFSGGVDATSVTIVQQSDIDGVINNLSDPLTTSARSAALNQLQTGQQLYGKISCQQPNATSDHVAGDVASSVTVTVSVTCSGEAYNQGDALSMGEQLLQNQASSDPGKGYKQQGNITTSVSDVSAPDSQGTIQLTIQASGTWRYQLTDSQKQALALKLTGKTRQQALAILQQQPGISNQGISIVLNGGTTLPVKDNQISFVIN